MQIVLIAMDYSNVYKIFLKDQTVFKNTCLKILSLHSCCMSCNFVSKVTRVLQYQISRITWLWSRIPPLYSLLPQSSISLQYYCPQLDDLFKLFRLETQSLCNQTFIWAVIKSRWQMSWRWMSWNRYVCSVLDMHCYS